MPQTLTDSWRTALGEVAERDHQQLLHTLGNLTLTGYNSELSNSPFAEKQKHYAGSNVGLNAELAAAPAWNAAAIRERGIRLAHRVLARWPSFAPDPVDEADATHASPAASNRPTAVVLRGQRQAVGTWVEVATATAHLIAETSGPNLWHRLQETKPGYFTQQAHLLRRPKLLPNGWYYEGNSDSEGHRRDAGSC